MSNEASVRVSVNIRNQSQKFDYRSNPTGFSADVTTPVVGPTPGAILIPTTGIQVSFAQLHTPGICVVQNLDETNYFELGIRDPATGKFYPIDEFLPGEVWPRRFSRNLLSDYYNLAGTGTDSDINYLWAMANTAAVLARFDAFEK